MRTFLRYFLILIVIGMAMPAVTSAAPIDDAKEGIRNRFDAVMDLKHKGLAGEGNDGFLAVRGSLDATQQKTLQDENGDRRVLFRELAKMDNSTPEGVAKVFAKRTIERQPAGVWVQDDDGDWYKKR